MIAARRSVMATVAVAMMLVTFTSAGSATNEAPLARCSADAPKVTEAIDGAAVAVALAAHCRAGELVVFQVSLKAEVEGLACTSLEATVEPAPGLIPTWFKVHLELACNPGEQGAVSAKVAVEMVGLNDVKLAAYSFGDAHVDLNLTNVHLWNVDFVAGVGELPPLDPTVPESAGSYDSNGSSQAQLGHEVY